jgi:histone H2A
MPKQFQFNIYIRKVGRQVHPDTNLSNNFLNQINQIIVRLGEKIAEKAFQLTEKENHKMIGSREIQSATRLILPGELTKHAVSEGTRAVMKYSYADRGNQKKRKSNSKKAGLQFSVPRCKKFLKKYNKRIGSLAPVYLAAVLEYITAEILELSGNVARDHRRSTMKIRDLYLAIEFDDELNDMMHRLNMGITGGGFPGHVADAVIKAYENCKKKKPKKRKNN